MILAEKINESTFLINGTEHSLFEVLQNSYRRHLSNGDIEIYEKREDIPEPVASFDLDSYKQQVNEAHNALFRSMYLSKDYLSVGEIPIWFSDIEFGGEAVALSNWWIETCKLVSTYLETVTEETALPVDEFINSLPTL